MHAVTNQNVFLRKSRCAFWAKLLIFGRSTPRLTFSFCRAYTTRLRTRAIARTVNIAAPDALETHQDIATNLRTQLLQLVGESDRRFRLYSCDRTETPLVKRPIVVRNELHFVSKIDNPLPQSLQIRFGAAARRITATHKSDFQLTVGH